LSDSIKVRKWLVMMALLATLAVVYLSWETPMAILFAVVTLSYTLPIFIWLDRLEPEPRAMRWNAFLWGAGVSTIVASTFNDLTTTFLGSTIALIISAPIIEETMKVLGILSAAKRNHVDSPLDGAIYAGYVALGFASVENVIYFSSAISENEFGVTFIARGLLSPLAHPYFSVFAGIFIGRSVLAGGSRKIAALKGLIIGIPLHAAWNMMTFNPVFAVLLIGHIGLFIVLVVKLKKMRQREIKFVKSNVAKLAFTHNISPIELEIFGNLKATRKMRQSLSKKDRRAFEERRSQITRQTLRLTK